MELSELLAQVVCVYETMGVVDTVASDTTFALEVGVSVKLKCSEVLCCMSLCSIDGGLVGGRGA